LGEAAALASLALGPFSASGSVRWDWSESAVSAVGGLVGARDARGDEAHASAGLLAGASSERLRGGIDELFSAVRLATAPGPLQGGAGFGGTVALPRNLKFNYEAGRYLGPDLRSDLPNWTHTGTLAVETPCHCAGLKLVVMLPFRDSHLQGGPVVHFVIDLKSLGAIGY
jgi:hypothetical protein